MEKRKGLVGGYRGLMICENGIEIQNFRLRRTGKIPDSRFPPSSRARVLRAFGGQAKILSPPLALSDILKRRKASPTIADCKEAKVGHKGTKMRRYVGTGTSRL